MHIIKVVMYLRSKPTTSIFVCHGPSIFGGSHRAELEWSRNCSSAKMLLIERHQLCFGKSSHHHQRRLNLRRIESVYTMYISYQLSIYVFFSFTISTAQGTNQIVRSFLMVNLPPTHMPFFWAPLISTVPQRQLGTIQTLELPK